MGRRSDQGAGVDWRVERRGGKEIIFWDSGFRVPGSGFRDSGFRVQGSGFRDSGFRVQDSGLRVRGSGIQGSEFRVQGFRDSGVWRVALIHKACIF